MGKKNLLKTSLIAVMGVSGLTLSACASHGQAGHANLGDFEGAGASCYGSTCGGSVVTSGSRYGHAGNVGLGMFESGTGYSSSYTTVGHGHTSSGCGAGEPVDLSLFEGVGRGCGSTVSTVSQVPTYTAPAVPAYTAPAVPTYTEVAPSIPTYTTSAPVVSSGSSYVSSGSYVTSTETAPCPAGTVSAGDGTCMQSGGSVVVGSTVSSSSVSYGSSASSYVASGVTSHETASCPSHTTLQSDGSCMMRGATSTGTVSYGSGATYSSGTSYSSGASYGSSSYVTSHETAPCPSGTVSAGDGTCRQSSNVVSTGYYTPAPAPAPAPVPTYGDGSYGYGNGGGYTAGDYMPIRK